MTEQTSTDDERCLPCTIVWNVLLAVGVGVVAFLAADVFTNGKATELLVGVFDRARPALAQVIPMKGAEADSDAS